MKATHRLAVVLLGLSVAACASSPVMLIALPAPPPSAAGDGQTPGSFTVRVRDVKLPGYLDNFPVVIGRTGNTLIVAENIEWAERLSRGVARVLRDELSQRLGATRVLIEGDRRVPDADLTIEFLSLDPRDGVLDLDARWFFSCRTGGPGRGGRTRLEVVVASAEPQAVANATTNSLARFADVLAADVRCEPSSAISPAT